MVTATAPIWPPPTPAHLEEADDHQVLGADEGGGGGGVLQQRGTGAGPTPHPAHDALGIHLACHAEWGPHRHPGHPSVGHRFPPHTLHPTTCHQPPPTITPCPIATLSPHPPSPPCNSPPHQDIASLLTITPCHPSLRPSTHRGIAPDGSHGHRAVPQPYRCRRGGGCGCHHGRA